MESSPISRMRRDSARKPKLRHAKLGSLRLGVSVGVACFPEDGQSCTSLISTADADMYSEKTERKLTRLAPVGGASERDILPDDRDLPRAA